MTIYEKALEYITDHTTVGLGSGRASTAFIQLLGERVKKGLKVRGVPTSQASADLAKKLGIPLVSLEEGIPLDLTVDGADEVDPHLYLIKGYGRALVREKIVAAASKKLVILVDESKLVPILGTKKKLPVEVVPFALPLCKRRLEELPVCRAAVPWMDAGKLAFTDNGNHILDCEVSEILIPTDLERTILAIPGVVGTGLFLDMAHVVLVGDKDFVLKEVKLQKNP